MVCLLQRIVVICVNEGLLFLGGSIFCDVIANICLKKSQGFQYKTWGFSAILLIVIAFIALSQAVKTMDLSIAYALWGALGLLLTTGLDITLYGVRLNGYGIAGVLCMITGVVLIKSIA